MSSYKSSIDLMRACDCNFLPVLCPNNELLQVVDWSYASMWLQFSSGFVSEQVYRNAKETAAVTIFSQTRAHFSKEFGLKAPICEEN